MSQDLTAAAAALRHAQREHMAATRRRNDASLALDIAIEQEGAARHAVREAERALVALACVGTEQ